MSRKKNTVFAIAVLLFVQLYLLEIPLSHLLLTGCLWWSPLVLLLYCGFAVPTSEPLNPKSMVLTLLCWEKSFGRKMIPPQFLVMDTVLSYQRTALVVSATELGLFDVEFPEGKPLTVRQLIAALQLSAPQDTKVDPSLVHRLLRSLSSIGFFNLYSQNGPRADPMEWMVEHSKESAIMKSSHPSTLRPYALAHGRMNVIPWTHLKNYIARPSTAPTPNAQNCPFASVNGQSFYEHLSTHPSSHQLLQQKMESIGGASNTNLLTEIPWSKLFRGCKTLVDVGGGRGAFLKQLFENLTEEVASQFSQVFLVDEQAECDFSTLPRNVPLKSVTGSFFHDNVIPQGADIYFIKFVVNDWDDASALTILRNIATAMRNGQNSDSQRLFLAEQLLPVEKSPFRAITDRSELTDLDFFVLNGGKVRNECEQESLLQKAGFRLVKIHWTTGICHVLEAKLS